MIKSIRDSNKPFDDSRSLSADRFSESLKTAQKEQRAEIENIALTQQLIHDLAAGNFEGNPDLFAKSVEKITGEDLLDNEDPTLAADAFIEFIKGEKG